MILNNCEVSNMFDLVFVIFTSFSKSRDPAMAMPAVLEKFYSQM